MSKEDSRHILVKTMQSALQSKGLHGVGLNEILKTAGLPKGSLYYHFPGGKEELALAAIANAGLTDGETTWLAAHSPALYSAGPNRSSALGNAFSGKPEEEWSPSPCSGTWT